MVDEEAVLVYQSFLSGIQLFTSSLMFFFRSLFCKVACLLSALFQSSHYRADFRTVIRRMLPQKVRQQKGLSSKTFSMLWQYEWIPFPYISQL